MATTITLENNVHLERLLMSGNKKMENKVRKIVRQLVREARDKVATATESMLRNDPRKTAHAIRSTVYKEVIGANLNILSSRKAKNGPVAYEKPRTLRQGQVGGNRIKPSAKTQRMESYQGFDRIFVLRWISNGTAQRTSRYGNRGSITARRWFGPTASQALDQMSAKFVEMVEQLIVEEMSK